MPVKILLVIVNKDQDMEYRTLNRIGLGLFFTGLLVTPVLNRLADGWPLILKLIDYGMTTIAFIGLAIYVFTLWKMRPPL